MLSYAIKRISRSWKLFAALALGMTLAATFFGGPNVAADTVGKQALDAQLVNTPVDVNLYPGYTGIYYPVGPYQASSYYNVTNAVKGIDGVTAAESTATAYSYNSSYPGIRVIQDNSLLYAHMTLVGGRKTLQANETLINVDSYQAQDFPINSSVLYRISAYSNGSRTITYNVTLKVVGTVALDTVAQNTLGIGFSYFSCPTPSVCINRTTAKEQSIFIASWQQTFAPIIDWVYSQYQSQTQNQTKIVCFGICFPSSISTSVNVYLDRNRLISPFGVENSISQVQQVEAKVSIAAAEYGFRSADNLLSQLQGFSQEIFALRLQFTIVSIPVFFLSCDAVIVTLVFAVILTFFSIFSPARQAAAMDPAQALKEYVYLEETRPRRKRGAIVAFSLGLYQLVLLFLGINYQNIGRSVFGANFFLALILIVAAVLSFVLTYIGPFLFLYGASQLSTGLAQRFHRGFASLFRKIIGEISVLASRSVFRNPRRVAALVFIVALIVGYSVWVIGDLASQQDYNYRQAEVQNGSDLHLSGLNSIANATRIASNITSWSNIAGATPETDFSASTPFGTLQIKAIDPATWRQGAYYESGWFSGDIDSVFSTLGSNNQTIVLDHGVASYLPASHRAYPLIRSLSPYRGTIHPSQSRPLKSPLEECLE